MPAITGIAHVELSVRDLNASEQWYHRVLGTRRVWEGSDAEHGISARALLEPVSKVVLGLTQHDRGNGAFEVRRPGLDHLAFAVAGRDELDQWEQHLSTLGIEHSPIQEVSHGASFSVRDPDGIALEFYVLGSPPSSS